MSSLARALSIKWADFIKPFWRTIHISWFWGGEVEEENIQTAANKSRFIERRPPKTFANGSQLSSRCSRGSGQVLVGNEDEREPESAGRAGGALGQCEGRAFDPICRQQFHLFIDSDLR